MKINIDRTYANIKKLQNIIKEKLLESSNNIRTPNFEKVSPYDLKEIYKLYDELFFENQLNPLLRNKINFRFSNRMTKSGGKASFNKTYGLYEIAISSFLLFSSFEKSQDSVRVNGILCKDRLEILLRIFEHEIVHIYEFLQYGVSSCSKTRFQKIVYSLFRHIDYKHNILIENKPIKDTKFKMRDKVRFEFKGQVYSGEISRITKRATVLVPDKNGDLVNHSGIRVRKFYVPLRFLELQ